jgi:hypothetical protein
VDDSSTPAAAKPNIIHATAMRLILDYAKSTDEAVELLNEYNVQFVGETCHLMIADASGKSEVVEFIGGEMKTTGSKENWQVSTTHQLSGKSEDENDRTCNRYHTASDKLATLSTNADADDVMNIMQAMHQDTTMWTSVYDLSTGEFRVAYRRRHETPYVDHIRVSK